jgi:hypothetical protein
MGIIQEPKEGEYPPLEAITRHLLMETVID